MADGIWKDPIRALLLNKFFDSSTPSMRKGHDVEKSGKKTGGKKEGKDG